MNEFVVTISQGLLGMREGIIDSFVFYCLCSKQVVHLNIMSVI